MQGQQNFLHGQQNTHETVTIPAIVSSTTPSENESEGLGGSLADLDSLTDLLPMMAPDLVIYFYEPAKDLFYWLRETWKESFDTMEYL